MRFAFFVSLKNVELDHFFTIKSHGHYKANATQSIIGLILTNLLRYSLTEQVFMITISDTAQAHFVKLLADQPEGTHIRVFVISPGTAQAECGVSYCPPDAAEADDVELPFNGFSAMVDEKSAPFLDDASIDFVTDQLGSQLTLKAPNAKMRKVSGDAPLVERIEYVIQSEINPQLASHGGNIMLVEITDAGVAVLQFGGGCNGCSQVDITLKDGIEKQLLDMFPTELTGVRDVTEHQHGDHSYA